ncbi:MAG: nucleotidyltransferase family protein [Bacteroidota bacterium]
MAGEKSIEGIILAAGSSFRAGTFKPGLLIGGKPMIALCIEGMYDTCRRIIVVGGHEFEQLRSLVEGIDRVECVENVSYQKGMFTSVKAGVSCVRGERCFLLPADIPLVPPRVYQQLLTFDADVVVPSFQGRNGHPVCFSSAIIPRILREPDESSLRDVVKSVGIRAVEVDAEEVLIDIDIPEDYDRVCQRVATTTRKLYF